jgi:hypothetical protein
MAKRFVVVARWAGLVFLLILGALAMAYGEFDDSPGLQGIGLIVIILGLLVGRKIVLSRRAKVDED